MVQYHRTGARYGRAASAAAGTLLYLAGQVGTDAEGNIMGASDVAAQTQQAFHNIGMILAEAGASFHNVINFTTYLVGRESLVPFRQARAEIYPRLFPSGDFPPNTLLIVSGLVKEDFLVEIQAVAVLP